MFGLADTMVQPDNEKDISPRTEGLGARSGGMIHEEETGTVGR
jgi:hypothetical protein